MTAVRRGADLEEPVELLDEGDWTSAVPVTTTRRRSRWPEALLVAAALAIVVGIGATSGGDDEDATDMPRTTSTTARRTTSSTTPRPTTTSTTWPTSVVGTGPVLGDGAAPTGTALVIAETDGSIAVLHLDSGDLCRADVTRDSWFPMPQRGAATELTVVDAANRTLLVDGACDLRPANRGEPWAQLAATDTTYWRTDEGPAQRVLEISVADGTVLRTFELPALTGTVADRDWLVLTVAGEMVAIDLHADRHLDLGPGQPVAVGGGMLVAIRCESLVCGTVRIDLPSARVRPLDIPLPTSWEPGQISPDGRWLLYATTTANGTVEHAIADLREGGPAPQEVRGGPCGFTVDSRWLLCVRPSVIEAVSLEDSRIVDLSDRFHRPTSGFGVLQTG